MTSLRHISILATALTALSGCFLFDGLPEQRLDPTQKPIQLDGSEIKDKLGTKIPLDGVFFDEDGQKVSLSQVVSTTRPTLLVLGYFECPMLCSLVLNATHDAVAQVDFMPGTDYNIVAISIDPTEKPSLAKAKQQNYVTSFRQKTGKDVPLSSWRFLTPTDSDSTLGIAKFESKTVRAVADAVGFGFKYDATTDNFAHSAGIFFVSPDGVLTRTLFGVTFAEQDVRLALVEAGKGVVGTITDKLVLSCFQFQPHGRYSLYVWGVVRVFGLLIILAMATFLTIMFRQDKKREQAMAAPVVVPPAT
jgi:protein SCO1